MSSARGGGLRARLAGAPETALEAAARSAANLTPVRPFADRPRGTVFGGVSNVFLAGMIVASGLAGCQGSDEDVLSVVISLPEQHLPTAAKATLLVDYSGAGARLLSEGGGPACAFILPGVDGDFSDDRKGNLTIHASGPRATRGPADLAACRMKAGDEGTTADDVSAKLSVRIEAAEDSAGKPIDLTAPAARQTGGSAGTRLSSQDVEEAQQAAVKAAATISAQTAAQNEAGDKTGTEAAGRPGAGPVAGPAGMAGPAPTGATASANAPSAAKPAAAKPAAPANVPRTPGPAPVAGPVDDNSAIPTDRDPGYDDSDSDDDTAPAYSLDFSTMGTGRFGALQLDITHLGNRGGFIGRDDKVECVPLVEAIVASNYLGERITKIGLISLAGIRMPGPIMRCGFRSREPVSPGSFLIEVTDASNTDSKPLEPQPTVVISSVTPRR